MSWVGHEQSCHRSDHGARRSDKDQHRAGCLVLLDSGRVRQRSGDDVAATDPVRQVTAFDVIWGGLVIACGAAAVALLNPTTGTGGAVAFASGCALPVLAYIVVTKVVLRSEALPRCRNRRCSATQYRLERRSEEGDYYRCACGDLYLRTPQDEFRTIEADGSSSPFKQRFYAGGPWRPPIDLSRFGR